MGWFCVFPSVRPPHDECPLVEATAISSEVTDSQLIFKLLEPRVFADTFTKRLEIEANGFLCIRGQPGLYSTFQDSQDDVEID